ncbi:hypothetical protein WN55_00436 [Dufourea novaeangliae]|uniref:Uncharacterized protein n=1 Tax=Dufourea novaeangliae TaxID=178035 RepID=A0A154PGU0_DUFNO|nr:hypothetical protein WN55_00436 [Dufourea novaeangliae]
MNDYEVGKKFNFVEQCNYLEETASTPILLNYGYAVEGRALSDMHSVGWVVRSWLKSYEKKKILYVTVHLLQYNRSVETECNEQTR